MEIERISDEEIRVSFSVSPTASDAAEWNDAIKAALTGSEKSAHVDLTSMEVISSMGVNVIVGLFKALERQNGAIDVTVGNEKMLNVFELFKLDQLFPIRMA